MKNREVMLIAAVFMIVSCDRMDRCDVDGHAGEERVAVSFVPVPGTGTKSSTGADEDLLRDFNMVIYRDGMLEHSIYLDRSVSGNDGTACLDVNLVKGVGYDLFALGNAGRLDIPVREEDFLSRCVLEYRRLDDFDGAFPMAWSEKSCRFAGSGPQSVAVPLARLVARINFSLDCDSILGRLNVNSVRIRQSASKVWPFGIAGSPLNITGSERSRALTGDDVVDGDYASGDDLETLNEGGTLVFYCLENCQGNLLPDNTDEWAKVPINLDDGRAGLCTFLEVNASYAEDFALDGEVTYRLYLGGDNTSDFNIVRNTGMDVSLFATRDGLEEVSWRVEPAGMFRDGLAEGAILEGAHPLTSMYVGEMFRYGVTVSPSLAAYLGEDLSRCLVRSGHGAVLFSNLHLSGMQLTCDGTCQQVAEGETLVLETPKGGIILDEGINVLAPRLVLSRESRTQPDAMVRSCQPPVLTVNGDGETLYLYCTDNDGCCLNSSAAYGFDSSVFSFSSEKTALASNLYLPESDARRLAGIMSVSQESLDGLCNPDSPVASFTLSAVNPGTDIQVNRTIGYAVFANEPFRLDIMDSHTSASTSTGVRYDIFPVTVTAYGPWTGVNQSGDSELVIGISNRSAIFMDILLWTHSCKRTSATHSMQTWAAQSRAEIAAAGAETRDLIYATSSYFPELADYQRKHYGSCHTFQYNKAVLAGTNEDEHYFHVPDHNRISLLNRYITGDTAGFPTHLTSSSSAYSGSSWWYSSRNHISMDIKTDGVNLVLAGRLNFEDRFLDGGGAAAPETYPYFDGFNVYSDGIPFSEPCSFMSTYTGCSPRNLYQMVTAAPLELTLGYDPAARKYYITAPGNTSGRLVEIRYRVEMSGTVTCHPNGQWYKAVIHDVAGNTGWAVTQRFAPGVSRTYIDDGAARTMMNKIYSMSYPDNSSNIGTAGKDFQHFCHPTSGTLTFEVRFAESGRLLPYVLNVDPSAESVDYYHAQDDVTYHVAMTIAYPSYWQFGLLR